MIFECVSNKEIRIFIHHRFAHYIILEICLREYQNNLIISEYNPKLVDVPRGARVAYAKFMTKKITVDYNQESVNINVINEQNAAQQKLLMEKQNSVLSLKSRGSQASLGLY